jgi:hypothetical protein
MVLHGRVMTNKVRAFSAPGGFVHDWIGHVFIPETTGEELISVLTDYDRHQEIYPEVISSRNLGGEGKKARGFLKLKKKKVVTVVLNTEHEAEFTQVSYNRWTGQSYSTRITEVKDAGEPSESELPVGIDSGILWRLNAYWTLEEVNNGVVVELNVVSLSRNVPFGLGWLIKPFINSAPGEAIEGTLVATRDAMLRNEQPGKQAFKSPLPGQVR